MSEYLEAKYLHIVWQNKDAALKIIESDQAIDIEASAPGSYQLDVINYSKIDSGQCGQLAFRLLNKQPDIIPFFQLQGGAGQELLPVKDNASGKTWWIENHWYKKRKTWSSKIFRSAGLVKLVVGTAVYNINISSSTFTSEQLNHYLDDFRYDLWDLILDDSSYIQGAGKLAKNVKVDRNSIKVISQFVDYAEAVLKTPKVELREVQQLKPRKNVRPVPRTFMELATRGGGRLLTSRASVDSLDVPENRYVHYALQRVHVLLRALGGVTSSYAERLGRNISSYQERLEGYSDVVEINEEAVLYDYQDKLDRLKYFSKDVQIAANSSSLKLRNDGRTGSYNSWALCFLIGHAADGLSENTFFAKVKPVEDESWFQPEGADYVTVEFSGGTFVERGNEYKIIGNIYFESEPRNGKTRHKYRVDIIDSIEIVGGYKLSRLKEKLDESRMKIRQLKEANWQRPLTQDEQDQKEKEILSVGKVITMMEGQQESMDLMAKAIRPKIPLIKSLIDRLKNAGVRADSVFPSSMTFVQNPNYQGVHTAFKKIRDLSGIDDDDLLLALERVENIGLINIALLYERWCLLQIIKILIQKYHYRPEENWKKKLISQVLDAGRNISIVFSNDVLDRNITLWYEKELPNRKRPDFILDVDAGHWDGSSRLKKRFVMDAKFFENIESDRHGGISAVIEELYFEAGYTQTHSPERYRGRLKYNKKYENKNYSEDYENAVFIIHPSLKAVPQRKTPQNWAATNYYGEVEMFDWDRGLRKEKNHKYGAISLSPVARGDYSDDLQRLIGMFLQYGIEDNALVVNSIDNENENINFATVPSAKVFCVACGSDEYTWSQGKNEKVWWATCDNCNHFTVYSYCADSSCRNRLIKNGAYWTYHSTEPLNPGNIKCPSCAGIL